LLRMPATLSGARRVRGGCRPPQWQMLGRALASPHWSNAWRQAVLLPSKRRLRMRWRACALTIAETRGM